MLTDDLLEALRHALFAGHYNLLLGSGTSLDSFSAPGSPLKSATELARQLCTVKDVPPETLLNRVSLLLTQDEIEKYITIPYHGCRPGPTVKQVTSFVWRTIYTFNVDDALEAAYERVARPKQTPESLNFDSPYRTPTNRTHVPIVHLHGFTREHGKGYVFSTNDYGRATRGQNPWTHVLSEVIASEPFIIAGTTLNEPDLEYYLSSRTKTSGRDSRGPSLLIEPFPNRITENICLTHGLILVKATLTDFLSWLSQTLGHAPSVVQLSVPSVRDLFRKPGPPPESQVSFFGSFELVSASGPNADGEVSPFYFGRTPRWSDLESALDVKTPTEEILLSRVRVLLDEESGNSLVCLTSSPGNGKTTVLRRAAYELSKQGRLVLFLRPNGVIDPATTSQVLCDIEREIVIFIDGMADHAAQLRLLLTSLNRKRKLVVIGADRDYRRDHIDRLLGDLDVLFLDLPNWEAEPIRQLLEKLRVAGLLGNHTAISLTAQFARQLVGDSVAIATCRALNNFQPLESIIRSLWRDAGEFDRRSYALAALSEHCFAGGIYYPILEHAQHNPGLETQLSLECPLPLTYTDDGEYVLPMHAIIAERLINMLSKEKPQLLLEVFCALAASISPYVNRRTAIDRTPEARLAARLFHAEQVARPLLGELAGKFYVAAREYWQWNSRYWEQRALFTQSSDIDTAIQYARHAVAIETHPYTHTTLAAILSRKMESGSTAFARQYDEIYDILVDVFKQESARTWRPSPHPFAVLYHATEIFLGGGGKLPPRKREWIEGRLTYSEAHFLREPRLSDAAARIRELLKN